jgi:hypothetical protein
MFGDIATSFYSSMLDTLATGAAVGEYQFGSGGTLTRWRESLSAQAKEAQQNLSQEMQMGQSRRFIPSADEPEAPSAWSSFGDFFGAVGAQAVSSLGSIIASLPAIGVGLLGGGPVGGMIAGGVTTGLLGMGTVWKDTAEGFQAIPEEDRKRLNESYRRNRETMSEAEALDVTIREAAGRIPELVGVLSAIPGAIMGRFESQLAARQLGGGVIRNAGRGMLTEGATEFPEEVAQNVGTQVATERLTGEAVSTADALEAGVRGTTGGGAMGGAMGAIGGAFQRDTPPAPANEPPPPAPPPPPPPPAPEAPPSVPAAPVASALTQEEARAIAYDVTNTIGARSTPGMDPEDALLAVEHMEANLAKGRAVNVAATEFGQRLDTVQIMAVNAAMRENPQAALAALRAALEARITEISSAPEAPTPPPPPAPPPPSATTQGVDPSLSSAVQQTETPPPPETPTAPRVDPSISEVIATTTPSTPAPSTTPPPTAETTSAPDITATLATTPPTEQGTEPPAGTVATGTTAEALPPTEIPTEKPMGAVEQLMQSPIEALRAEGITLDEAETQRFGELDSDVEAYRKFLDCIRGLG